MQSVKVVALTKTIVEGVEGIDEFIAYCARVSNPSNQMNYETAANLIQYCIKNQHWSIFEMANVCMEINTTRDIARQILRHRSFSFQEFSQRYADPTKDLDFMKRECRLQDTKNRQNSIEFENDPSIQEDEAKLELIQQWNRKMAGSINQAKRNYAWAVENGIAKEQARCFLPEGLTMSRMYMNGSIRSWLHYINLRSGPGTQKEHREIANMCKKELVEILPNIFNEEN
tara:strand:- start:12718 stop:13404 length:687 start_codon:yes stop_codon:yes gene_type:complete